MSRGDADAKTLPDVDRRNFSLVRLDDKSKSLRRSEREGSLCQGATTSISKTKSILSIDRNSTM